MRFLLSVLSFTSFTTFGCNEVGMDSGVEERDVGMMMQIVAKTYYGVRVGNVCTGIHEGVTYEANASSSSGNCNVRYRLHNCHMSPVQGGGCECDVEVLSANGSGCGGVNIGDLFPL